MPESGGEYEVLVTVLGADGKYHSLSYPPAQGNTETVQDRETRIRKYLVERYGRFGDVALATTEETEAESQ